jgi:long-subunit acyl-CoA synthetase (AMP-forming)
MARSRAERRTLAPFEKVRKIAFVEDQFSISGGELTPTLKVRRSAVEKKYKSLIDQLTPDFKPLACARIPAL